MTAYDGLTLQNVKKSAKIAEQASHRVSDFLSNDQKREIAIAREKADLERGECEFDEIDAYSAEILARFGYNAWQAWQDGQIKAEKMIKMVLAERARTKRQLIGLEALMIAVGAGANNPTKNGHAPKSLRNAITILKSEQKLAKGAKNE